MKDLENNGEQIITQIDDQIVEEAVHQFNLGDILKVKKLETKGNRKAFKATTNRNIVVIKSAAPESPQEKVDKDIYVLKFLDTFHYPAPKLIQTPAGDNVIYINGRAVYGYQFIDGEYPRPSTDYFYALGKLLAQLHSIPFGNYPFYSAFTPDKELPKLRENLLKITRTNEQIEVSRLIHDIDTFPSFEKLPRSIIHTDPYFSNIIQKDDQLYSLDLDDAGIAPSIIDIGFVIAHCCTTEPGDREEFHIEGYGIVWHQDWAYSFLKGYQDVRSLREEEKKHLPDAARFAMLVYITDWEVDNKLSDTRLARYKLLSEQVPLLQF